MKKREISKIFSAEQDTIHICRCEEGIASLLTGEYLNDEQTLELIKITYEGKSLINGRWKR